MRKRAIAIIQARMSSSRLPGKVMMPLAGRPMIWHIVQRAKTCEHVSEVIVATSSEPSDDALAEFCAESSIQCYRGSLNNVLSRYIDILDSGSYDCCVRITGDCPLIDPAFIDQQILALRRYDGDFVWLPKPAAVLEGQGVHSVRSLLYLSERTNHPDDQEHVGSRYLLEYPEEFMIIGMRLPDWLSSLSIRLTVDQTNDLRLMQTVYNLLWDGEVIPLGRALELFAQNPGLAQLNQANQHSIINQELASKRKALKHYVDIFYDWHFDKMEAV